MRGTIGAVVTILSFPYPGLARILTADGSVSQSAAAKASDDATFWSGVVTAKYEGSLVLTSPAGSRRVLVAPGPSIWREIAVSIDAVSLGDSVMAKGDPQPDGSLAAWSGWVWVNIGQWHGTVSAMQPDGLVAKRHDGVERFIHFTPRLEVVAARRQVPIPAGIRALAIGMQIGAVGLRLPDRSMRATRLWMY